MGQFSVWHWAIVAAVFLLFFGAKRMPDAARGLGRSLRIFKSEVSQMQSETDSSTHDTPAQKTANVLPPPHSSAPAASERVFLSKPH